LLICNYCGYSWGYIGKQRYPTCPDCHHKTNPKTTEPALVQHHIKYKELQGVDEIVVMTESEHRRLHNRLRKVGKCTISTKKLREISSKARERTQKAKQRKIEYKKGTIKEIEFTSLIESNIRLHKRICYNLNTGSPTVFIWFAAHHNSQLKIIDECSSVKAEIVGANPTGHMCLRGLHYKKASNFVGRSGSVD